MDYEVTPDGGQSHNALVPVPDPGGVRYLSAVELRAHYSAVRKRLDTVATDVRAAERAFLFSALFAAATVHAVRQAARSATKAAIARMPKRYDDEALGRRVTTREIQLFVCNEFGFALGELLSHRHMPALVLARHAAMWLTSKILYRSLPEIGRSFANRDHTTVLHALRRIDARIASDPAFSARVMALRAKIEGRVGGPTSADARPVEGPHN